jgi:hypothetical protein
MLGLWTRVVVLSGMACVWASGAGAQDPLKTLPKNYQKIFENERVAVIRAHYGGHEKIPVHDHPAVATVFVYLSDSGQVRIDHVDADGKVEPVVRPPTVTGSYRIAPGLAERHRIENLGDASSDFLRVELKGIDLKMTEPFRGKAPASLAQSVDVMEFSNPAVSVERVLCVGPAPCPVKSNAAGSLLIAVTPMDVEIGAGDSLEAGAVRWMKPGESARIGAQGSGAAEVLRILLPGKGLGGFVLRARGRIPVFARGAENFGGPGRECGDSSLRSE